MRWFNPLLVWSLPAIGDKTVTVTTNNDKTGYTATVSDKTGYSLTAGSYSVRASSSQAYSITDSGVGTGTSGALSAVTLTRVIFQWGGQSTSDASDNRTMEGRARMGSTTTVTSTRGLGSGTWINEGQVSELF